MSLYVLDASQEAIELLNKKLDDRRPSLVGLIPVLIYLPTYSRTDSNGIVTELLRDGAFEIGWYIPEKLTLSPKITIEVGGRKLLVASDAWSRLKDHQLILEWTEVGYPEPSSKRVQHLRCEG